MPSNLKKTYNFEYPKLPYPYILTSIGESGFQTTLFVFNFNTDYRILQEYAHPCFEAN